MNVTVDLSDTWGLDYEDLGTTIKEAVETELRREVLKTVRTILLEREGEMKKLIHAKLSELTADVPLETLKAWAKGLGR